jgi:hypothetical protein
MLTQNSLRVDAKLKLLLLILASGCVAGECFGQVVKLGFSGTLTSVTDHLGALDGMQVGDHFSGFAAYDLSHPASGSSPSSEEQRESYGFTTSEWPQPIGLWARVGNKMIGTRLSGSPFERFHVEVIDYFSSFRDVVNFGSSNFGSNFFDISQFNDRGMGFQLTGDYNVLSGIELPTAFDVSQWTSNSFSAFANANGNIPGFSFGGPIEFFEVVPEPAIFSFLLPLIGLVVRRHTRCI